jgi:tricorn protease interacting factor F2/3
MLEVNKYEILLDFDESGNSYKGNVKIELKTDENLGLNASEMEIKKVKANGKEIIFEYSNNILKLNLGKFEGIIEVDFEKKIPESLVGIYKVSRKEFMITTQFEASHARDMFPCIDHPAYKAIFELTVKIRKDLDAISNMPIEKIEFEGEKKLIKFKPTPRMSTYLLYLGISKFEEIKDKYRNVDVIVATTPGKISKGKLALDFAKSFLEFYERYYGIEYSLPKLHLIAVPEFAYGAMENWGAITFREAALLLDENSPLSHKRRVATTVAHELAHLWFGDLVTMKWWDDLWLNESFATFMSYKAVASKYPEWRVQDNFFLNEQAIAFNKDALASTHPIEAKVKEPEEVEQLFDEISYSKGASVLRMIESYLGEEEFRKGIQIYLKKFSYGNAEGKDLWLSLEEASKKGVEKIMQEWIKKKGYPYVSIRVEGEKIKIRQERFSFNEKSEEIWPIPLTLEVNGKMKNFIFDKKEDIIDLGEEIKKIKVNLNRAGFYRVFYENLSHVIEADLSKEEKFGLINDYFAFLLAGMISADRYEELVRYFMNVEDNLLALEISDELYTLALLNPKRFKKLAIEFHNRQYEIWKDKKDELSRSVLGRICERLSVLSKEFAEKLSSVYKDYERIDPNLKQALLIAYIRTKGEEAFYELVERYRKEIFDEERERLLTALINASEPHLVLTTTGMIFTGEIKRQDVRFVLYHIARNPDVRNAAWIWLRTNFDSLANIYSGTGIFGRLLPQVIPFLGIGREEEVEKFLKEKKIPEITSGIRDSLELLKVYSRISKI